MEFVLAVACKNVSTKLSSLNQICGISVVYLSKPLRQFSSDFIHSLGLKNKLLLNQMQQLQDVLLPIFHSFLAIEINFVTFVCFISLASVQIYIEVVLLCDLIII